MHLPGVRNAWIHPFANLPIAPMLEPVKRNRTLGSKSRLHRRMVILVLALACAAGSAFVLAGALAAPTQVSMYPIAGSRVAPPGAQIAFRGVSAGELGTVTVTGSSTGGHAGTMRYSSDGRGASFLPDRPFKPGEVVTVSTGLNLRGASHGTYHFTVASPAGPIQYAPLPPAPRSRGDVQRFHSQPGLTPAAVKVTKRAAGAAPGAIFLAPQQGPLQNGPMIVDQSGRLIWFKPLAPRIQASDFRVQSYQGKPVLTWWQGYLGAGAGVGEDVIMDDSYHQIATVRAANGLHADLHEFKLTPRGTALITAYYPVWWDASSVHAAKRQVVMDSVVQEIDVRTGLLLFEWHSLDHVPLSDTQTVAPKRAGAPLDHFHVNSVEEDREGNLLISARNTSAAYRVERDSGRILWTLGGRHSSFKMSPGASFAFQHDVRVRANGDRVITLFDNGGGPPRAHDQSRGLTLSLDFKRKTATRVAERRHAPALAANYEGNLQRLPGGGSFLGWGQQPYFAEFGARGQLLLDGRFVPATAHYRAYLLPWSGTPSSPPSVSTSGRGAGTTAYASWNGATGVASWRVLTGARADALTPAATAPKRGFETAIRTHARGLIAVQALDASGRVLGTSAAVPAR